MTKREHFHFTFHDHTGIVRHLEDMAQKGWMLTSAGFFWKYRQEEPQNVRYAVTYFPDGADPGDPLGEKESLFRDLCESAGWEFVTRHREMQIFRSFRANPVPLDTEPMVQVETIHKGMKSGHLSHLIQTLIWALIFYGRLHLMGDVVGYLTFLASNLYLLLILVITVSLIINLWELISYYRWRRRAKAAAKEGQFLPTSCRRWPHLLEDVTTVLLLACLVWILFAPSDSRGVDYPDDQYDWGPFHYSIYDDEMPLYMDDLILVPKADYSNHLEETSSPLLRKTKGEIELRYDRRDGNDAPRELEYTVWTTWSSGLLDLAVADERNTVWKGQHYAPIPAAFGAESVWQLYQDGTAQNQYLLRFEDRVIEIRFPFAPNGEQLALAAQKLLNH